jgi:hypothetical protein
MSSNWNVYKLFKNGKRAKAPIHTFSHNGDNSTVDDYFKELEIKNLVEKYGEKIKKFDFKILNANNTQERIESTDEQKFEKSKNKVLGLIIKSKDIKTKRNISGGLVYSKETNWKWQWAALESATNNYIEGLSECFDTYEDAIDWMKQKIDTN